MENANSIQGIVKTTNVVDKVMSMGFKSKFLNRNYKKKDDKNKK